MTTRSELAAKLYQMNLDLERADRCGNQEHVDIYLDSILDFERKLVGHGFTVREFDVITEMAELEMFSAKWAKENGYVE